LLLLLEISFIVIVPGLGVLFTSGDPSNPFYFISDLLGFYGLSWDDDTL
jgi:hypothetical protein